MNLNPTKKIAIVVLFAFLVNTFGPVPLAHADDFVLPTLGTMVHLSPAFNPPVLKGIKVHPENPFRFEFILDKGDCQLGNDHLKAESTKLIKYFLVSLTIPENDLWVNLSPYEKNRIVPESFGQTEMGRDLLAEDYMLKQITASLIYPENEIGKKFWKRIYEEAAKKFGTTNIPVNTFNKVWIVPEKAMVYENAQAGTAYVIESRLKVMLEEDYLSLEKHSLTNNETNNTGSQIIREIIIPQLTKEVNEGKNFAQLRQVYHSLILAAWYKKKIKDSILNQLYSDQHKIVGVTVNNPQEKERIYQRYLQAFKRGVYNFIKEEQDPLTQKIVPRKYFSGGAFFGNFSVQATENAAMIDPLLDDRKYVEEVQFDAAMKDQEKPQQSLEKVTMSSFSGNLSHTDGFYSVGDVIGAVNRVFYIFNPQNVSGFMTEENITHNDAEASAKEFYSYLQGLKAAGKLPSKIVMQEWGIGRGSFLMDFLVYFLQEDRTREFLHSFEYQCYDISQNILDKAQTRFLKIARDTKRKDEFKDLNVMLGKVTFHQLDLSKGFPKSEVAPVFVRFEELYDDFSGVEFVERTKSGWKSVKIRLKLRAGVSIENIEGQKITFNDFLTNYFFIEDPAKLRIIKDVSKILENLEYEEQLVPLEIPQQGYFNETKAYLDSINAQVGTRIPLNIGALNNLIEIPKLFSSDVGGVVQFFDYGFHKDLPEAGSRMSSFKQEHGGHLTVGINFGYLEFMVNQILSKPKLRVQKQLDWQKESFGDIVQWYADISEVDYGQLYHFKMVMDGGQSSKIESEGLRTELAASVILQHSEGKERAMAKAVEKSGGIDLSSSNRYLQTQNSGREIKFYLNPAQLAQLQNAPGFVPVIISIKPMRDLKGFLAGVS